MAECKWMRDEICVNADCPMRADYCPVVDYPGVCRFEDRPAEIMTNGDRIRALSDEKLAELLADFDGDYFCRNMKECEIDLDADKIIPIERCRECALLWLKSEYKPKEAE